MSKLKLEFDLSNPDDRHESEVTLKASKILSVLWDLDQILRNSEKHGYFNSKELTEEQQDVISKIRESLYDIMSSNDINLNDLMR